MTHRLSIFLLFLGLLILFITNWDTSNDYDSTEKTFLIVQELQSNMHAFQKWRCCDANENKVGEYPSFLYLEKTKLLPEKLKIVKKNIFEAHGYYYTFYLPNNTKDRENFFIIYVWPVTKKSFVIHIDQDGVYIWDDVTNVGLEDIPNVDFGYFKKGKNFEFGSQVKSGYGELSF